MHPTRDLAQTPLFQLHPEGLSLSDRIQVTYERAKAIGRSYVLTAQDLLTLSPKFWQLHTDPIWSMDGAAGTLNTLQYNCCGGTLAMFAKERPDIAEILQQVLDFSVSGQYCLTEVGHGLDAFHLETTATLLPSGEFKLNTPSERAAKYMPPTTPVGMPCIAIVFACAMIEGEDCGVKPFVVYLHNGKEMRKGVVCKVLPQRGGSRPMNHSLTYFNRVRLPYSALLGSAEKPVDPKMAFFHNISRVAVGTIAISSLGVPALQVASFIAAKYSFRRTVVNEGQRKPIMEFRTQKTLIVTAIAQSFVMRALHETAVSLFRNAKLDYRVHHAIASILKVVMIQHAQAAHLILGDRCGAQGLFEVNQLTAMHADMRGTAIAEGDLLGISIHEPDVKFCFATELLLKRYAVPDTDDPASLLAKHEVGLFEEMSGQLAGMKCHRSPDFDRLILPECLNLVQAVGHRMAYDAAVAADVDPCLINLYLASCVKLDAAWYVEKLGLSRAEQRVMESDAVDVVFERLQEFLGQMDVEPYISAPLISDESWFRYVDKLVTFGDPGCLPREESVPLNEGLTEAAVVTVTA